MYIVSGCNEVVNFTDYRTGENAYKIYDKEAQYGFVTQLQVSGDLLAIGYSSGTIIVVELDVATAVPDEDNHTQLCFNVVHKFAFHKTAVTCILFDDNNTQLFSGGQDTYIVVYDLVSDSAQFKLTGHKEEITELSIFEMQNPKLKNAQKVLISASKDGFLKFWDLQ